MTEEKATTEDKLKVIALFGILVGMYAFIYVGVVPAMQKDIERIKTQDISMCEEIYDDPEASRFAGTPEEKYQKCREYFQEGRNEDFLSAGEQMLLLAQIIPILISVLIGLMIALPFIKQDRKDREDLR